MRRTVFMATNTCKMNSTKKQCQSKVDDFFVVDIEAKLRRRIPHDTPVASKRQHQSKLDDFFARKRSRNDEPLAHLTSYSTAIENRLKKIKLDKEGE
jgi:hypothetical protein